MPDLTEVSCPSYADSLSIIGPVFGNISSITTVIVGIYKGIWLTALYRCKEFWNSWALTPEYRTKYSSQIFTSDEMVNIPENKQKIKFSRKAVF